MHTERHAEQGRPTERVVAKKRVCVTAPVRAGSSAPYEPAFSALPSQQKLTRGQTKNSDKALLGPGRRSKNKY